MDEKVEFALKFIKENLEKYKDRIALISSFGKDSIVANWLVRQIKHDIPVLWVKPPFLPEETITFAKQVTKLWDINLVTVESHLIKDKQFMEDIVYKPKLYKTNPENCCIIFKDEPMFKKVREMKLLAWFSGLRSTESEKRSMFTWKWEQKQFTKLHPILNWTEADVWRITAAFHLPVHPWYKLGYRSLGCTHCSFPNVWTAERGGRWLDTAMEGLGCGLHCLPPYMDNEDEMMGTLKDDHSKKFK